MNTSVLEKAPSPAPSAPPLSDSQEEQQWVRRARTGDMAAYDELVRRYQERIYATIYHMTSNHEDANDLAQETFIKAFQALKSFKGDSSFFTWVYRIAVNKTINVTRMIRRRSTISASVPANSPNSNVGAVLVVWTNATISGNTSSSDTSH